MLVQEKLQLQSNYQWIYTAMTRAKKYLYVANDFFIK